METLSGQDRLPEQKRLALVIEEVLDDEGWELDIEFTPEGFLELPELLQEFLENEEVSPEARVQLEVLGRLIKKAAGAAGRVAGEWHKAGEKIKRAKASIRKSYEAGKRRAFGGAKPPAQKPKPSTKKKLLGPDEKMVFGTVRKVKKAGSEPEPKPAAKPAAKAPRPQPKPKGPAKRTIKRPVKKKPAIKKPQAKKPASAPKKPRKLSWKPKKSSAWKPKKSSAWQPKKTNLAKAKKLGGKRRK